MKEPSVIGNWYANQHIFITGATGFMGKALLERLLWSCRNVGTIYLLIRAKRGKQPAQRLEEFLKNPIFDLLHKAPEADSLFKKIQVISGDLSVEDLGLSNDDKQTLQDNVTIVFHMAANVRFDQPLKTAVLMNTGGALRVLELASTIKNLKAFVHVSTCYCHCDQTKLEERMYRAPHNPRKILDLATWMDEDLLESFTPKLITNAPNTYAYTKCLTEELVGEYATQMPIAIARPSIVIAAWREPIPGWIDNLNGPTGLLVGAGKGVIRTMHCNADLHADIVPVDVAINNLLIIAWKLGTTTKQNEPLVYHITASKEHPITWRQALEYGRKNLYENPFSVCLWYPGGGPISNYFLHAIAAFFLHMIPAYLVDFVLVLTGNKPFLVRAQKRIHSGLKVLQYYTTRPWYFYNDRMVSLYKELNQYDRTHFYNNDDLHNYDSYMLLYILGARKYCVKEDPETLPSARKLLKRLYYLDLFAHFMCVMLILWLFVYITKISIWN